MEPELHLPDSNSEREGDVWAWYSNIPRELEQGFLTSQQRQYVSRYYGGAGLLQRWRRRFFRRHFGATFARAAEFLLEGPAECPVVDLGCGCGTQSLYLALNGARVLALDRDELALAVLRRRLVFYQEMANRELPIKIELCDAFEFDYSRTAPLGGFHSVFAFNMMQPSGRLVDALLPHFAPGARFAVTDGNMSAWVPRLLPWRRREAWTPEEFEGELGTRGFRIVSHSGGAAVPPIGWCLLPRGAAARLDTLLSHSWFFPVSHQVLAEWIG